VPHAKCAAFELPFTRGERFGPLSVDDTREVLRVLARRGLLHEDDERGVFHWIADAYPAQGVPLRGISDENFSVIDVRGGQVLAEVDYDDAAAQLHPNAIYPLEGRLHQVERLDWDKHEAFVRAVDVDYTTEAMTYRRVSVLEPLEEVAAGGCGEVHVVERVVGFKKIRLHTHENIGYGEVALPDQQWHTRALWLDPIEPRSESDDALAVAWVDGVARAAHALAGVAALIVMSEGRDLGRALGEPETRGPGAALPRIFLFDRVTGGAGLAEKLYEKRVELCQRAAKLIAGCACRLGCPACVGAPAEHEAATKPGSAQVAPAHLSASKQAARVLLESLARRLAS
jgi:DEAD/DEAH box helicase domain-containing protein